MERCCYLVAVLLLPLVFFWPNLRSGSVMLPLDILHHLEPFSSAVPPPLEKVHNPHISDLVTLISWIMPRFFGDVRAGNFWGFSSFLGEAVYIGSIPLVFACLSFFGVKKRTNHLISAKDFPFESTAVVTVGRGAGEHNAAEDQRPAALVPAEIQRYDAETVEIRASSAEGGWLILSDLFYPGWEATCDGTPVGIFPGNYLFRAVRIPPGSHLIRFAYNPLSFRLG
jgi:hypothetical protein